MTRDDIINMAREAEYFIYDLTETHGIITVETDEIDQVAQLERFAALVAAAEREACAKLCEEWFTPSMGAEIATAIRARSNT